ncbi:MAG TPA: transposase [Clostridia bacterium]|nr:transposase [Clostridia bacterium]
MPRDARVRSKSRIYHIMLRGINKQDIFEDEEDVERLLETIKKYKEVSEFEIFAYCIMSNHIHMLIRETEESISNIIKRISSSYVFWYNKKYERCGHMFQERFRSEAVESDEYFLSVLRYIHQNPVKAGIVKDIHDYKWNSYKEYIGKTEIVDVDFALDMYSSDRKRAIELFQNFNMQRNNDMCLEDEEKSRVSDSKIKEYFKELDIMDPKEVRQLEKGKRDEILKKLKIKNGVTIRQLSRITGISKSVIDRT